MKKKILNFELKLWKKYPLIAGIDEAGRGALAGPLVVVAIIMPNNFQSPFIQDSKLLSPYQRNHAYQLIKENLIEYKLIFKGPREIEKKNPLEATKEAMINSILNLKKKPDLCLIDGKEKIKIKGFKIRSIIKGDRKSVNIAAASIMAKVVRDSIMKKMHYNYPLYDWINNKGYYSKTHLLALLQNGICCLHRKNYEPIKTLIKNQYDKTKLEEKYKL